MRAMMNASPSIRHRHTLALAALAAAVMFELAPAGAQAAAAADDIAGHADHGAKPAPSVAAPAAPAAQVAPMDHDDMKMQGGAAPPDARDPNAYSCGYTLGTGPYALGQPPRMADEHMFGALLFDRLKRVHTSDGGAADYEAIGWYGTSYNRLVVKAEGEAAQSKLQEARN